MMLNWTLEDGSSVSVYSTDSVDNTEIDADSLTIMMVNTLIDVEMMVSSPRFPFAVFRASLASEMEAVVTVEYALRLLGQGIVERPTPSVFLGSEGSCDGPDSPDVTKAKFPSRSEAGRYAANVRWQDRGGQPAKVFDSMSSEEYRELRSLARKKEESLRGESAEGAEVVRMLEHYVRSGHVNINAYLREMDGLPADSPFGEQVETLVRNFDKYAVEMPFDRIVNRGLRVNLFDEDLPRPKVGDIFSDRAFSSASASRDVADRFADPYDSNQGYMMMRIRIPKGTKVSVPPPGYSGDEQEILLRPDSKFRIVGLNEYGDPDRGFVTIVEVDLVG